MEVCRRTGSASAWEEFVSRTQNALAATISSHLRRFGVNDPALVEDLLQETYLKLSANQAAGLRDFTSRHADALLAYLRAIAVNVVIDHCRSKLAFKRGSGEIAREIGDVDPPSNALLPGGAARIERNVLLGQIDQILLSAAPDVNARRDRQMFWLYYRQGLSAEAIAAIPYFGLTVKGVESAILRVTRLVRAELSSARMRIGAREGDATSAKPL